MVPFVGNLTWQALKRVNTLDDPERELLMSIVGTVIYYSTDQNRDPDVIAPTLTSITATAVRQSDAGCGSGRHHSAQVRRLDRLHRTSRRTRPTYFKPFTTKVEEIMTRISDKIATRSAAPTAQEIGFVNMVSEPVYRMLVHRQCGQGLRPGRDADPQVSRVDRHRLCLQLPGPVFPKIGMAALAKDFGLDTAQKDTATRTPRSRPRVSAPHSPWRNRRTTRKVAGVQRHRLRARAARPATARQHAAARHRHAGPENALDGAHHASGHARVRPCTRSTPTATTTALRHLQRHRGDHAVQFVPAAPGDRRLLRFRDGGDRLRASCRSKLVGWKWLASVLLVYSILLVPKVTVGIVDKLGTQPVQVVANVPFGVAFFGQSHQRRRQHAHRTLRDGVPGAAGARRNRVRI